MWKQLPRRSHLQQAATHECRPRRRGYPPVPRPKEKTARRSSANARSACIEDAVVYGWAVHFFEEDSIEGTLYNEDGTEYKTPKPVSKTKPAVSATPPPAPKQKRKLHPNPPALLFGRTIRLCKTNIPAIFLPTVSAIFTKFSGITQNCSQSLSTLRLRAETALGGRYNLYRRGRRCA